ncbi:hypothetical protein GCM10007939_22210 [Amylibacter marinus]|uniref:Uncharacterized protein n=2 Tax=Amylibacter marinus TaxID=1475483 RepID=A0ABQ5VWY4_9RHOB|nr:hypothetical protein GCM10007939_22210 [Amylibacter marinus]
MLSPILIIVTCCVIQFMMMTQAQIVMKSAAYAAARSALVHGCPTISLVNVASNVASLATTISCSPKEEEWENAARIALLPIASSSPKSKARGGCNYPEALITIMMRDAVRNSARMRTALENKACYVFEPDNVAVQIDWQSTIPGVVQITRGPPPVKAKVQFKLPVLAPVRMIFSTGELSDGTKIWAGEAEVTVL